MELWLACNLADLCQVTGTFGFVRVWRCESLDAIPDNIAAWFHHGVHSRPLV